MCLVDGSRLDKYAEVLICRFVYRILPRIYIHSPQSFRLNYWNAKKVSTDISTKQVVNKDILYSVFYMVL